MKLHEEKYFFKSPPQFNIYSHRTTNICSSFSADHQEIWYCHNPSPSPKSKVQRTWSDSIPPPPTH